MVLCVKGKELDKLSVGGGWGGEGENLMAVSDPKFLICSCEWRREAKEMTLPFAARPEAKCQSGGQSTGHLVDYL